MKTGLRYMTRKKRRRPLPIYWIATPNHDESDRGVADDSAPVVEALSGANEAVTRFQNRGS